MKRLYDRLHLDISHITRNTKTIEIMSEISNKRKIYEYESLIVYKIISSNNYILEIKESEDNITKYILPLDFQKNFAIGSMPPLLPEIKIYIYTLIIESEFRREYHELLYKKQLFQTLIGIIENSDEENNYDREYLSD